MNWINQNIKIQYIKQKKKIKINNLINFKKIDYYYILKNYFCFNDKKNKLINICHNIINEDMCIERILKRFYYLENIYNYFSDEEKRKFKNIKKKYLGKLINIFRK